MLLKVFLTFYRFFIWLLLRHFLVLRPNRYTYKIVHEKFYPNFNIYYN